MERRKFEDSFKDAFNGAEVSPSDNVWTGIELELEKVEGDKIKRKLVFYKMLAAASVTFALCVAGVGYYMVNKSSSGLIQQASNVGSSQNENGTSTTTPLAANEHPTAEDLTSTDKSTRSEASTKNDSNNESIRKGTIGNALQAVNLPKADPLQSALSTDVADATNNYSPLTTTDNAALAKYSDRSVPSFYTAKNPRLVIPDNKPDPGALLLAQRAAEERAYAQEDKKEKLKNSEKLWTSVGMSAGTFSSVNTGVAPPTSANMIAFSNSSVPDKQANASGVTYSFGVNVGTRISKRWVLQGGVNYLTQSSDYIATNVVGDNNYGSLKAESINELDKLPQLADAYASSKLAPTFPYSVNNNVKFFSVPVQAGYLLVNRKFGLQFNAGVSTDLFLQNTITPEGGSLDRTTQGRGEDSPYRSVNFSGLMGTEVSYRFAGHYRLALSPGLRYPLNSVYKADVGIQSTPLTFDVGLRFRYIFH